MMANKSGNDHRRLAKTMRDGRHYRLTQNHQLKNISSYGNSSFKKVETT